MQVQRTGAAGVYTNAMPLAYQVKTARTELGQGGRRTATGIEGAPKKKRTPLKVGFAFLL